MSIQVCPHENRHRPRSARRRRCAGAARLRHPIAHRTSRSTGAETVDYLTDLRDRDELSCKLANVRLLHRVPGVDIPVVAVVGGGQPGRFGSLEAFQCLAAATKELAAAARKRVVIQTGALERPRARAAVAGAINGCHGQDLLRAERKLKPLPWISWLGLDPADVHWGTEVGRAMLLTRELVNLPPNRIYPESFVHRAAEVAISSGLELEVWDELRLRRERCGCLLEVARGSQRPPRLLILRYRGQRACPPLALVGKGVTFDSGGLSLKPSDSMLTMKCDMAGAATVLGAMQAIAHLQLATPVVGLVGLVENMISGSSYRLGDVLTARNGKTVEVHNTDAEGRLVLADVLDVAVQERPAAIIDIATLTGACVVALGTDIAGLMSNDDDLQQRLRQAAVQAGEEVWPLPMSPHFADQIRGKVGDLKNVGEGRWGGAITAAKFLEEFVAKTPWVHVDIAGPAFYDSAKPFLDAGASGVMVRSLVQLAEHWPESKR